MAEREGDGWHKHVELPALLVEAKVRSPSAYVEGDAPIAHGSHAVAASSSYEPPPVHRAQRGTKGKAAVTLMPPPT